MMLTDLQLRRFWEKVALPDAAGCMLWTAAMSEGYGQFSLNRRWQRSTRISLHLAVGPPPSPKMQAAHSCRNKNCVAPAHLRWATASENAADKHRDGTAQIGERCARTKLTPDQVREIRQHLANGRSKRSIGREYGVTDAAIYGIDRGLTWKHLQDGEVA